MKKILSIVFLMLVVSFMFSGCSNKELVLKEGVYFYCSDWHTINDIVDFEKSGLEYNEATLKNTSIEDPKGMVLFDGKYVVMNKKGSTNVKITINGKSIVASIDIISQIEWYDRKGIGAENLAYGDYKAAKALLDVIDNFKEPSSIEVINAWGYKNSSGDYSYFVYKIRAKNSFGGYVTDCFKVQYGRIQEINDPGYDDFKNELYLVAGFIEDYLSD